MSEGTHSSRPETTDVVQALSAATQPRTATNRKRTLTYLVAGSAVIALVAAVLFQVFRAEPGEAGTENTPQQQSNRIAMGTTLARVDGQPITWREVADECMARYGRDILENIINRTIIQQACAKRNIVVTNAEVAAEVRRIAAKFKLTPDNWYQMLQAERNITPIQYRRDIIWPMLALKKIAGAKIQITEADLQKPFIREYGPRVKAKMILMDNQRRAIEVHAQAVRNPANFERLAQQHSIEPTSRALGGEIPPIRRYSGNKLLEDEAFKLREGEVSRVITVGPSRFVILMSEGKTKPVVTSIDQVRQELYEAVKEERTQAAVAQIFDKLRRQTRVDNFLTGASSGIRQTSGSAAGKARVGTYPQPSTQKRQTPKIR
ncbi:MAG: hypothetical protein Tsb009_14440 [Planctomycetaceae bacterium]